MTYKQNNLNPKDLEKRFEPVLNHEHISKWNVQDFSYRI